jgi:hypothetical protein
VRVGFWASGAGWLELSIFLERFGGMVAVGSSYGTDCQQLWKSVSRRGDMGG